MGKFSDAKLADKLCGDGWISVGDAAFTQDPLSGKGIEFAVESATFAANLVNSRLSLELGAMKRYEEWVKGNFAQHQKALKLYTHSTW